VSRDSSVGIATRYGPGGPGIESRWRRDFPRPSRPALEPTRPPIQWVPNFFTGGKATGAWPLPLTPSSAEVKEKVELFPYSHSCCRVIFTLTMEQLANIKLCFRGYKKQTKYLEMLEETNLYLVRVSSNDLKD
jgi:hypothetical protein